MTNSQAIKAADGLLEEIAKRTRIRDLLNAEAQQQIDEVHAKYGGPIEFNNKEIARLESALIHLAAEHLAEIFPGDADRADTRRGWLIRQMEARVKKTRCVLGNLEAGGFKTYIKVNKSVDWAALDQAPDEFLNQVGTERVRSEKITYGLREDA